ncbi:MAG TPA: aminoacyl--tRNA ligase-related protein [Patescibacteria group bacterium]|nr:aminoacyl--tRNA ligase-related protein [Patescibacteria group bacterium]
MRYSQLFAKTSKSAPADAESVNAKLLTQGGFIYKNSAGVYSYLPFGWRVMQKIAQIIREEMNAIGGQELLMPALHDKHYLKATGRWDVDVVFKVSEGKDKEPQFNISWTHEEIMSEIASRYVNSYKDLPFAAYQIQTKFRNEPRAKSGLLRGREFMMKDLYSFHRNEDDLNRYYEIVKDAYFKVFNRCGLKTYYTLAAGGDFTTNFTHEFQAVCPVGEDTIYICSDCEYAENKEVTSLQAGSKCPKCGGKVREEKSIEVGNIFRYGTKYSEPFNLHFTDEHGKKQFVTTGAYGIGLGRMMGTLVETFHDDKGIIWPESVAPFKVHLIALGPDETVMQEAEKLYKELSSGGVEVLYDDRADATAGEKFSDADLIGLPVRLVISKKTLAQQSVEFKRRNEVEFSLVKAEGVLQKVIS